MRSGSYSPMAFETLTVDNTVGGVGLSSSSYTVAGQQATWAEITIDSETGPIRFRIDGGAPTTSSGHHVVAGQTIILRNTDEIRQFRGIRTGATSATCQVTYWRNPT